MYKHILIATDGSEIAGKAVTHGLNLAKACNAKASVITVTQPFHSLGDRDHMFAGLPADLRQQGIDFLFDSATTILEQAHREAETLGVAHETMMIEHRHPYDAIILAAKDRGCDLIVVASHGRSGFSKLLLGSETVKILAHAKTPVLICR